MDASVPCHGTSRLARACTVRDVVVSVRVRARARYVSMREHGELVVVGAIGFWRRPLSSRLGTVCVCDSFAVFGPVSAYSHVPGCDLFWDISSASCVVYSCAPAVYAPWHLVTVGHAWAHRASWRVFWHCCLTSLMHRSFVVGLSRGGMLPDLCWIIHFLESLGLVGISLLT